jgi:PAS domain S-box-containing protein
VEQSSAIRSGELSAQTVALLDLAPDAIFARDADRQITFWNRGAENTYGYSGVEALGVRPRDLLKTEYPIPLEEIERIVTDTGAWEGDLVQHTKDGRSLVVESRWAAQYDEAGGLAGLLEVNRDISARIAAGHERERLEAESERERLQNRLHQAERLESLGQLAGGIAHDFNNLLAVIINYAAFVSEELDRGGPAEEDGRQGLQEDVEQISLAAEKAADLTHQLLVFARREVVQPEVIDVNDVVSNIEQLLGRTLGEHIELQSSLAAELSAVVIDPGQLEQILVNLAVNARDAMSEGGTLRIDTANVDVEESYASSRPDISPGPHIRVRVSDTGVGMSAETVSRAFDPFFTTKPSGKGTGLGLATVYGIIQQAGGRTQIYSEPGVGTTFTVLLPAAPDGVEVSEPMVEFELVHGNETILLVEDEQALCEVTRRILAGAGYQVLVAGGGLEAIELAEAHGGQIDLLLSDVVMPQMAGTQAAEHLRGQRPATRVLLMSGFAQPILDAGGHLDPGVAFIEKPFSGPALLSKVAQILKRPGGVNAGAVDSR